jgi:hypothetical protein
LPQQKGEEMTEMALRSRMAVLVVAALLSIAGAFGTSAFLAADEAKAAPYNPYYPGVPGGFCPTPTNPFNKC